jgi:hypothetical protein
VTESLASLKCLNLKLSVKLLHYSYAGERESLLQMEKQRFKKIHLKEKIDNSNI